MTKEEDCQVLNLLDMGEQICQFKENLTRRRIMSERFRAGWTTLLASRGKGWIRRAKGVLALLLAGVATKTEQKMKSKNPPMLKKPKIKINQGKSTIANCH
jgi:hypothetical protein